MLITGACRLFFMHNPSDKSHLILVAFHFCKFLSLPKLNKNKRVTFSYIKQINVLSALPLNSHHFSIMSNL